MRNLPEGDALSLPKGWVETTLGENIVDIAMGPFGSNLKVDSFIDSGVPVIKGGNLSENYVGGNFSFVSEEKASSLKRSVAHAGDIIVTHRGTLGQVSLVPSGKYERYVTSQSQIRFTLDEQKVDKSYLLYFLKSRIGQYELLLNASQVGVPAIATPTKAMKRINLCLPPLPEQKAIADMLSSFDAKIELLREQNKTLETLAQTIFKEWLSDSHCDEWEFKSLGEVLEITSSKRIFYHEYVECGVPFYRSKEIIELSKKPSISTELYITESRFAEIKEKFSTPTKGDILLTSVGTLGIPYQVRNSGDFYFKDGNLTWLKAFSDEVSSGYIYCWLKLKSTQNQLDMISIGSTQRALTIKGLKTLKVPVLKCKKKKLSMFSFLETTLAKINHNHAQVETISKVRDALLPKLMSGKVRVTAYTAETIS